MKLVRTSSHTCGSQALTFRSSPRCVRSQSARNNCSADCPLSHVGCICSPWETSCRSSCCCRCRCRFGTAARGWSCMCRPRCLASHCSRTSAFNAPAAKSRQGMAACVMRRSRAWFFSTDAIDILMLSAVPWKKCCQCGLLKSATLWSRRRSRIKPGALQQAGSEKKSLMSLSCSALRRWSPKPNIAQCFLKLAATRRSSQAAQHRSNRRNVLAITGNARTHAEKDAQPARTQIKVSREPDPANKEL